MSTRRELLVGLLGLPLALTACRAPRAVPGSIRGARLEVGHRLLDAKLGQAPSQAERTTVAIVGAGPSGLAAAWRLEQLGIRDYRVFDLERLVGGTSASGRDGVVPYPWGAHYVPLPRADNPKLLQLLEEVGAVRQEANGPRALERVRVRSPEERLFIDERWVEGLFPSSRATPADQRELERFEQEIARLTKFRDERGRPAFTLPMRECSDAAELVALDRISAADWLSQRGIRSPLVHWYAEYACRDDYGASLAQTSAWAMLFYFAARKGGSDADSAPFLTWPEGNGRIVARLNDVVGQRLSLNRLVTEVSQDASGVELSVLDVAAEQLLRVRADYVILALPKLVVSRILRGAELEHLSQFRYAAWLVANLHLKQRPRSRGFPFAWDNVLYDSPALGYVVATHQTLADHGPTIWTYYRPLWEHDERTARSLLRSLDHETAVAGVLTDLERAHTGLLSAIERVDVYRWGHAMVTPQPGLIWGAARKRALAPVGRVHFAHSDLSGLPLLEEAFDRGLLAAEAVFQARLG